MTIFNTYWTVSYFLMLAFVFITLFYVAGGYVLRNLPSCRGWVAVFLCAVWAALGTHFFHCIW